MVGYFLKQLSVSVCCLRGYIEARREIEADIPWTGGVSINQMWFPP